MKELFTEQDPPCPHYNSCGGCSMQHIETKSYEQLKQKNLLNVLNFLGVDAKVASPLICVGQNSRRRVELKVSMHKGELKLGFFAPKSHEVVNIETCLVMEKRLLAILPMLRKFIIKLKKPSNIKSISLTAFDSGVDVYIKLIKKLHNNDIEVLNELAENNAIIRIATMIEGIGDSVETTCDSGKCIIKFEDVAVSLPVGAFLQATAKGQQAITKCVIDGLKECKSVADIYSGCGTYSFPLLKYVQRVSAYEGSEDMVLAMHNAVVKSKVESRASVIRRDIYKNPLKANILNQIDGVVINPPRNGALPQVKQIANSNVKKVVMVSCNPNTFKRDAKCLLEGGYKISSAIAIDQFYWTQHLEIVAAFVSSE